MCGGGASSIQLRERLICAVTSHGACLNWTQNGMSGGSEDVIEKRESDVRAPEKAAVAPR